jgi:Na+-driven multidrug efflux pump
LFFYGAKGDIMAPATIFLSPVIVSVPFPAFSMMEILLLGQRDKPPCNGVHDYSSTCKYCTRFCIYKITDLGLYGAGQAGIPISRLFILWYFIYKTELKLQAKDFKFHLPIIKEITPAWSLF